jgi:hypothetical protein
MKRILCALRNLAANLAILPADTLLAGCPAIARRVLT